MHTEDIHKTAIVSPRAVIGNNVKIGAFTIIYDNVVIEENSIIEGYCEIGVSNHLSEEKKLFIGKNSYIRSHSIFYEGSSFGEGLETGHRVTVREKTVAGKNLRIGTLSDIQGHCTIGDYVRVHSSVFIAQGSIIGNFVWLFPYVILTNDPTPPSNIVQGVTVKDYVAIAARATILPNITIAERCLIGAHSCLNTNTEAGMLYSGNYAKKICSTNRITLKDGSGESAYPWTKHFHTGYPKEIVEAWIQEK